MANYLWNQAAGRYQDAATGKFVPADAVQAAVEAMVTNSAATLRTLTQALLSGTSSLEDWRAAFAGEIKALNVAAGVAAGGGFKNMTPADYGRIGAEVRKQYGFLNNFAQQVASGKQPLNGSMLARSDLYAKAARGFFVDVDRLERVTRGATEERRVLNARESCPDCEAFAAEGWVPIGTLPRPGEGSVCLTRCLCTMEFQ